ncbi:hypothetical protein, partial [Brucella sp. 22210]|uniref:hypothetical protein n=1 Tax=Brucella sp. 22210 TaxID=3453892 RepID=UPI003F862893
SVKSKRAITASKSMETVNHKPFKPKTILWVCDLVVDVVGAIAHAGFHIRRCDVDGSGGEAVMVINAFLTTFQISHFEDANLAGPKPDWQRPGPKRGMLPWVLR